MSVSQETWFVKGILKLFDILFSVFNNLTVISDSMDKNLHIQHFSFVHAMGFLLIKSAMGLSFLLIWYIDAFISLKAIRNLDSHEI